MDKKDLCILLLGLFVFIELQASTAGKIAVKNLGCYEGEPFGRKPYHSERSNIDWATMWKNKNFTDIVQGCAKHAKGPIFAVHYWGECREPDKENPDRFKSAKKLDPAKCYGVDGQMVGAGNSAVYEISQINAHPQQPKTCSGGYANGEHWIKGNDIQCSQCKCSQGKSDCIDFVCHFDPFDCPHKTQGQPGKCCTKKCACYDGDVPKKDGEKWTIKKSSTCRECQCVGGAAKCTTIQCSRENCYNPVYIPGQCCPYCSPKAPVTDPWVRLTTPEQIVPPRPPRPPRPPHHIGKRSIKNKSSK